MNAPDVVIAGALRGLLPFNRFQELETSKARSPWLGCRKLQEFQNTPSMVRATKNWNSNAYQSNSMTVVFSGIDRQGSFEMNEGSPLASGMKSLGDEVRAEFYFALFFLS